MKKMNFYGIGPKIGRIIIPWLALTIVASYISDSFKLTVDRSHDLTIAGAILLLFGLIFYFSSARLLLNGLKSGKLVTGGTFGLCQNPLYISFILFLFPAIALLLNSWLVFTSSLVGYVLMKIYIGEEYRAMEGYFGDEYLKYRNETPEFIPLPFKKWFSKK